MRFAPLILTALLALGLAGCGVRGSLEPPSAANAPQTTADNPEPAPVEDRPFILDGLLL
jgi:predicted small lipoprotein YifL